MSDDFPEVGPLETAGLRDRLRKALGGFLDERTSRLNAIADDFTAVSDAISEFVLDGGKRIRPAFCYWGWRGAGGHDTDEIISAAASLEFLHACALMHDDVMDESDTRRGRPAMHHQFTELHDRAGWRGNGPRFGRAAAILLGDLCLVWADEMLHESGIGDEALRRATPIHDAMRVELMAGQYLDVLEQARGGGDVARALRVARFKTAKYTIERPLHFGAQLAGAGDDLIALYSAYGVPLGEAFQLRDDVLGVFGDPSRTGKPAGDDLREGKRTVLVALAAENAAPAQAEALDRLLGDPTLDDDGIATLREIINETGALGEVERMIRTLATRALDVLGAKPGRNGLDADAHSALASLARAATARRF